MNIGVLGSGAVGKVLAGGFARKGHTVTIGTRDAGKLAAWQAETAPSVRIGDFAAAGAADVVILAVQGAIAENAIRLAGIETQIVIDATNPIAGPAVNGMIPYFTGPNDSLMERLQRAAPRARFVKAFNSVGNAFMIDPVFAGGPPTMFICGNDPVAKATVTGLLREVGWDAEDVGGVEGARAIEPLCQLWCAPGLLYGRWTHAFKLLKR